MKRQSRPTQTRSASPLFSRRDFLATTAALAATTTTADALAKESASDPVSFFLVGDTHYLANKDAPGQLDDRSRRVTTGLIDTLNALPGTKIPDAAAGGSIAKPHGVS